MDKGALTGSVQGACQTNDGMSNVIPHTWNQCNHGKFTHTVKHNFIEYLRPSQLVESRMISQNGSIFGPRHSGMISNKLFIHSASRHLPRSGNFSQDWKFWTINYSTNYLQSGFMWNAGPMTWAWNLPYATYPLGVHFSLVSWLISLPTAGEKV
jgi:hypothetical protein